MPEKLEAEAYVTQRERRRLALSLSSIRCTAQRRKERGRTQPSRTELTTLDNIWVGILTLRDF